MNQATIKDTMVRTAEPFIGADGRIWKRVSVQWENLCYAPGQYVMLAGVKCGADWPTPLTIQRATGDRFTVIIHPDCPLYGLKAGDAVAVWGPNGTGVAMASGETAAIITDARGCLPVRPYVEAFGDHLSGVYLVGGGDASTVLRADITEKADDPAELKDRAAVLNADKVLMALPVGLIVKWKQAVPDDLAARTYAFIAAKIACGVGGCKSCFITSGDRSFGFPVCCKGPMLPLTAVDFARDQDSLIHYI
ncbi:MAG: hypothetical protein LBV27_01950 [Oscillospiraceae bacterium]|jgi:hypothetical protein|nr:hypothetical protein [Oscillospiraceae bacterium]